MSRVVEYIIKARNETKQAVEGAKEDMESLGKEAQETAQEINKGTDNAEKAVEDFEKQVDKSTNNAEKDVENMSQKVVKQTSRISTAFSRISGGFHSFGGKIKSAGKLVLGNLANIHHGIMMLAGATKKGLGFIWASVQKSFNFETLQTQFSVLLHSEEGAQKRIAQLAHMAAHTPFTLNELAGASRQLHALTDGVLGGVDSLKLIGDTSAATGVSMQELSFWIGRSYSAIQGGQPWGVAAMRLQQLGVLTPEVRKEMEDLQASGANTARVWEVLENRLKTFDGGMIKLSTTGNGLISTLKDNWTASVRTFGDAFADIAKDGIKRFSDALVRLKEDGTIELWANRLYNVLKKIKGVFDSLKAVWDWAGKVDQKFGDWLEKYNHTSVGFSGRSVKNREITENLKKQRASEERARKQAERQAEIDTEAKVNKIKTAEKARIQDEMKEAVQRIERKERFLRSWSKIKVSAYKALIKARKELDKKAEQDELKAKREAEKKKAEEERKALKQRQKELKEAVEEEKKAFDKLQRAKDALISPQQQGEKVGDFVKNYLNGRKEAKKEREEQEKAKRRMEFLQRKMDKLNPQRGLGGKMSKREREELLALQKFFKPQKDWEREKIKRLTEIANDTKKTRENLEKALVLN